MDPAQSEPPAPLLGVAGHAGRMDPDGTDGLKGESHYTMHSATMAPEGAC